MLKMFFDLFIETRIVRVGSINIDKGYIMTLYIHIYIDLLYSRKF